MTQNISIGCYHPSTDFFPNDFDLSKIDFFVPSGNLFANPIILHYPNWQGTIRTYLQNGKDFLSNREFLTKINGMTAVAEKSINHQSQLVFNECFFMDGNLRRNIKEADLIFQIEESIKRFNKSEIIINEMNPYHLIKYTGNGFQSNGVIPFINKLQSLFPDVKFSLGVQTLGNYLCKDTLIASLNLALNWIKKNSDVDIHFTEVGYFYLPYESHNQKIFLDQIKEIALNNNISSLCYVFPWDGDNTILAGQPRGSICGLYNTDWTPKLDSHLLT